MKNLAGFPPDKSEKINHESLLMRETLNGAKSSVSLLSKCSFALVAAVPMGTPAFFA
jgi:hypothetical protein